MGKKRVSVLGSAEEEALKKEKAVKLEQKKLREGKGAKAPGLKGGQRVVDTTAESIAEYETVQAKIQEAESLSGVAPAAEKTSSKKKIHIRSGAYKTARALVNADKTYPLAVALDLLKKVSLTKFDPTVELHITLKGGSFSQTVDLPFTTGKTRRIAVADDATIAKIEKGTIDFDVLLASPAQMPKVIKLAKVLGPKGLLPNPKNGTVVADPVKAASDAAGSISISLKTEKSAPLIHTIIGKLSQKESELTKNTETILKVLPANNIRKVVIKSTMSPAIKLVI
jgi:large subunit ribosomal protein L1